MNGNRIQELEGLVRYHADLYYNQAKPEITDAEFDALVEELKGLAPDSPALGEVGAVPTYGKKLTHSRPMGSLDKAKSAVEVVEWHAKNGKGRVSVTPKMDGAACRLNYRNGVLVQAASRGNGCVDGETQLETEDGKSIPIREIVSKGLKCRVKCLDVPTGKICFREVDDVFDNGQTKDWIELTVKDGKGSHKLILTPNHQVLSLDGGKPHFVRAKDLKEGEDVFGT